MTASVKDLIVVLELFFPAALSLPSALYVLATIASVYPILLLHKSQQREPRQPQQTAWFKSLLAIISAGFQAEAHPELSILVDNGLNLPPEQQLARNIGQDLEAIYELLGLDETLPGDPIHDFFPRARQILVTSRTTCIICPLDEFHTLRRREQPHTVRLLNRDFTWIKADLFVAHCPVCRSDYYPDIITFTHEGSRLQKLEYNTKYLRVSKHGIWMHRNIALAQEKALHRFHASLRISQSILSWPRMSSFNLRVSKHGIWMHRNIALAQEKALHRFHAGWSNFAGWLNDTIKEKPAVTNRQSQRLFLEHFSRRLLTAHNHHLEFTCPAHPSSTEFAEQVCSQIGRNGGVLSSSMHHGCMDCTHSKRYKEDLIAEGAFLNEQESEVAGVVTIDADESVPGGVPVQVLPPPALAEKPPQQNAPPPGTPRGYVRLAVMDGKTIGHRLCALDNCKEDLVNYKNGRFCNTHINLKDICGIIPCGQAVSPPGSLTCDDEQHREWYRKYSQRFTRLSYPGVRRVIRRQQAARENNNEGGLGPTLQVQQRLPMLNNTPGDNVVHTFRAQSVYCLQTIQWACGVPIGWGKCYKSESAPQVLAILDRVWMNHPDSRPSFLAYDDACDLLRHVATQDPQSPWLKSTKFIVDAWHYIGHRATDLLCRIWCNPAPTNGSQPDLVVTEVDNAGATHTTRAFNTETAEQLNSWLDGFEAQLRQMSATNYDFFVHVLMLVYKETVEERILRKGRDLPAEFWNQTAM